MPYVVVTDQIHAKKQQFNELVELSTQYKYTRFNKVMLNKT